MLRHTFSAKFDRDFTMLSLQEWDFELKEEKRQNRESRLFLARKMSELEAVGPRWLMDRTRVDEHPFKTGPVGSGPAVSEAINAINY